MGSALQLRRLRPLAPAVVPGEAIFATAQRAPAAGNSLQQEEKELPSAVEAYLARAGAQRMTVQDDDAAPLAPRDALQAARELDLLAGIERFAEAAELAERRGVAEQERTGGPARAPAERVPRRDPQPHVESFAFQAHRAAAAQASAVLDCRRHVVEQFRAGKRIRVDENQPVAGGARGAGIARARDPVHRLEHYAGSRLARDLGGAVGRVVVADDELGLPAALVEFDKCLLDVPQ